LGARPEARPRLGVAFNIDEGIGPGHRLPGRFVEPAIYLNRSAGSIADITLGSPIGWRRGVGGTDFAAPTEHPPTDRTEQQTANHQEPHGEPPKFVRRTRSHTWQHDTGCPRCRQTFHGEGPFRLVAPTSANYTTVASI